MSPIIPRSETLSHATDRAGHYNGMDLAKFICAVFVFMIHIPPFPTAAFPLARYLNYGLLHCVCRLAVPFFFMSSGFLLFRKINLSDPDMDVIKNYCFKLLRLLGAWHVLLIAGGSGHLWYLGATIVAVILLSLCLRLHVDLRNLYLPALLLYGIGLLGDAYYGLAEPLRTIGIVRFLTEIYGFFFQGTRNGVFMGFIFVLMGASFAHMKIRMRTGTALLGFAASMVCMFGEVFLLKHYEISSDHNMRIFLLPAAFFFFYLACNIHLKDRPVYKQLRITGTLLYFLHPMMHQVALGGVNWISSCSGLDFAPYQFLISLILTLSAAALIAHLSGRETFKWLQFLYS